MKMKFIKLMWVKLVLFGFISFFAIDKLFSMEQPYQLVGNESIENAVKAKIIEIEQQFVCALDCDDESATNKKIKEIFNDIKFIWKNAKYHNPNQKKLGFSCGLNPDLRAFIGLQYL